MTKSPSIMVIDDDVDVCSFLKDLLTGEGYTVVTATDPEEGLRVVGKSNPDLVVLDLKMPKMGGIEVLRRIKRIDEAIAVIVITGFGTMETAKAAMQFGAFDYITKPFDLAHIKALVLDALAFRVSGLVERLKTFRSVMGKKELAVLKSVGSCRPEGACVWEVVVRGFLLGDARFVADWMEQPDRSAKDKKNFARLTEMFTDMMRKAKEKEAN